MKVERIPLPEKPQRHKVLPCEHLTANYDYALAKGKRRCSRMARFMVDGVSPRCTQHAGEMALLHLLNEQGAEQ